MMTRIVSVWLVVALWAGFVAQAWAEGPAPAEDSAAAEPTALGPAGEDKSPLEKFKQDMSGVTLKGQFTVLGREKSSLSQEEYTIASVTKLPRGDYWLFNARMRYGK
jgi:hypothetical protein